jgi:hypothetical protein
MHCPILRLLCIYFIIKNIFYRRKTFPRLGPNLVENLLAAFSDHTRNTSASPSQEVSFCETWEFECKWMFRLRGFKTIFLGRIRSSLTLWDQKLKSEVYPPRILTNGQVEICLNLCVRFEVLTAVTMKNAVFWDMAPCGSCVNRRFVGTSVYTISTRRHIPEDGILHVLILIP